MIDNELLLALVVFVLRIVNNAVSTLRLVFIARQRIGISTALAFFESTIFAFTVASVVSDLSNPIMLIAYSGGFAVGSFIGMHLERLFVKSFLTLNAILQTNGHEAAAELREAGFGVTESIAYGKDGEVRALRITLDRRDATRAVNLIRERHPNAFITTEETRSIRAGYIRPAHGRLQGSA